MEVGFELKWVVGVDVDVGMIDWSWRSKRKIGFDTEMSGSNCFWNECSMGRSQMRDCCKS